MTRKKKQERLFEELDPSELEALTKELGERVGEVVDDRRAAERATIMHSIERGHSCG